MTRPKLWKKAPLAVTDKGSKKYHIALTIATPGLEDTLKTLIAAALAHAEREGKPDGYEAARLDHEAQRIEIDKDRQKLAWEEFRLRKAEFESRERAEQERLEERRAQAEERKRESEKRVREDAIARGNVYDVWLTVRGATPIQVIKVVREVTNLGLKEAKELVDSAPCVVKELVLIDEAQRIHSMLAFAGANAEMRKSIITQDNVRPLY